MRSGRYDDCLFSSFSRTFDAFGSSVFAYAAPGVSSNGYQPNRRHERPPLDSPTKRSQRLISWLIIHFLIDKVDVDCFVMRISLVAKRDKQKPTIRMFILLPCRLLFTSTVVVMVLRSCQPLEMANISSVWAGPFPPLSTFVHRPRAVEQSMTAAYLDESRKKCKYLIEI